MSRRPRLRRPPHSDNGAELTATPGDGKAPKLRLRQAPAPQAKRQWRLKRALQPISLLGITLVLVALVAYVSVYNASTHRTAILVTTRAVPAGAVLQPSDLRGAELAGPASLIQALEPAGQLDQLVGQRLQTPVAAGVPLPRSALSSAGTATASAFALAVPALHALGGSLQPGDRVTVLATFGAGTGQARTRVIARGLEVLAVGQLRADADPTTATVPVTVALPSPSVVSELALANEDGKIDLLREGAGAAAGPIAQASDAGGGP